MDQVLGSRPQAGINGTELFEEICCEVAKKYWGSRANGLVFGTARRAGNDEVGNFPNAVNDLCHQLGEGQRFHNHWNQQMTAQDGNLDIVVWKDFTDNLPGKLIGFGQCKTGRHWSSGLFDLEPSRFCRKWVQTHPAVDPVRLYFIASRVRRSKWFEVTVDGGMFFDRCRIMDFAPTMPELRPRWIAWTQAALALNGLAVP